MVLAEGRHTDQEKIIESPEINPNQLTLTKVPKYSIRKRIISPTNGVGTTG